MFLGCYRCYRNEYYQSTSPKKLDDGIVGYFTYYFVSYGDYLWLTFSQLKEWII